MTRLKCEFCRLHLQVHTLEIYLCANNSLSGFRGGLVSFKCALNKWGAAFGH